MSRYERLIKIALDKLSGEVLNADEIFDKKKDAFEIRRKYQKKELLPICYECDQDLEVSGSKYDRLHFKHKSGHAYCFLTDETVLAQEHEKFLKILQSKESERHQHLKNKIGSLLQKVDGVEKSSIAIDNKFIIRDDEKRRPDVYCKYYDKELVFEIQLSDLSLGYILNRYEFYKKHGMYLIWVLDNFNIHNQGTLEKDIKYLTKYENFFKVDENVMETLNLVCEYKDVFLTDGNQLRTKWQKKSVPLSQVRFDDEDYQIYYSKFGDNKTQAEIQQRKRAEEIETEHRRKYAEAKANRIIEEIKIFRDRKAPSFVDISMQIYELDEYALQAFNSRLKSTKKSPVIHWISTAVQGDVAFIEFILNCHRITLDVNLSDQDGMTAFQAVYKNTKISRYAPLKALFKRGYKLTDSDRVFFSNLPQVKKDEINFVVYELCNNLSDRTLVDMVFSHSKELSTIESAKQQKIVGFNYQDNEWIAFANNAVDHYYEYWEYIELAFKKFGLWDTLTRLDKKGTFANKLRSHYSTNPKQNHDLEKVIRELYPELGCLENVNPLVKNNEEQ